MRINVYAEELTEDVEIVEKKPDNVDVTFYGIRFYLKSPESLHHSADDDDRSAITLWIPWTQKDGFDSSVIKHLLLGMYARLTNYEIERVPE